MEEIKLELFGAGIQVAPSKANTNAIRIAFKKLENEQKAELVSTFYTTFSNLDDLYTRADMVANEVRSKSIELAMTFLASTGIYEITERQFYDDFMASYDVWDADFGPIAESYELLVERTAELDTHRTARRHNRAQWVGFNQQGVNQAEAKNLISNVGHGVFNLMAKGVTAIGNAIKKDELFKRPTTVSRVGNGIAKLVEAAFAGVVDAINALKPGVVYFYSTDEVSRAAAIIENVQKNRIPKESIVVSLLKAIDAYPYDRDAYVLLLLHGGGDQSRLDSAVSYFGLKGLDDEKKRAFDARRMDSDLSSLESMRINLPILQRYAKHIGYVYFDTEATTLYQAAAKKAFDERITSLGLNTAADFHPHIQKLQEYASQIDYRSSEEHLGQRLTAVKLQDLQRESEKYTLDTFANCAQNLPILEEYARSIDYRDFEVWAADVRNSASKSERKQQEALKVDSTKPMERATKPLKTTVGLLIAGLLFYGGYNGFTYLTKSEESGSGAAMASIEANDTPPSVARLSATTSEAASVPQTSASAEVLPLGDKLGDGGDIPQLRPLSSAAQQAITEGFVEIKDPAVIACTDSKISAFREKVGADAILPYDTFNEFAVQCGFNI